MKSFTTLTALVAPLDRVNVDTDAIIPKQFLKSIKRSGFGINVFDAWRYLDHGEPDMKPEDRIINPDFVLNQPQYQGAQILLTRKNFGCGSSREHAPWALDDYGFRAILAPSFADIFFNNCYKNGLLPIILSEAVIEQLFKEVSAQTGYQLHIDLPSQTVTTPNKQSFHFDITEHRKHCLLNGLDEISLTLQYADEIKNFEDRHRANQPWLYQ